MRTLFPHSKISKGLFSSVCAAGLLLTVADASAHWAYVTNEKDDSISVIDTETNEVVKTIDVGERPRGVTLSHDYTRLFICASDSDTVQVMMVHNDSIEFELPSGEDPEQFALHPDNRHLYIANEDDAIATVVDIETRQVVSQIDVGVEPEGMADSHDGKYANVTSETSNNAQ